MFEGNHLINEPAFGFLVPSSEENVPILGVIYDTCSFPQGDKTIFTVMMGGAWFDQLFGQNPSSTGFLYFISSKLKCTYSWYIIKFVFLTEISWKMSGLLKLKF